jgi:hypothetical protein
MLRKGRTSRRAGASAADRRPLSAIRNDQPKRPRRFISQRDTAWLAQISTDRYWRIEDGWAEATPEEKRRIAKVLGVKVGEIAWRVRRAEMVS